MFILLCILTCIDDGDISEESRHNNSKNPFTIIGVFYPKNIEQTMLF